MPSKFSYHARTFAAAGLSVSGIRAPYEQPPYTVRADLGEGWKSAITRPRWRPSGSPRCLGYDPPFAIPFLKRNETR